ncbi:MAG: rane protein [Polaromonas sp.]|nr:rane protein [Polaromonas sp.]
MPGHIPPQGTPTPRAVFSAEALDERARKVVQHIAARKPIARNLAESLDEHPSFGLRAADAVARFGGSWTFVGLFAAVMLGWVGLNALLLLTRGQTFDPYPYILLNLFLSMLAAIQAPVILMSQNRQAQKDRITAEHDYEVNLKAELEIMLLHEKIDALRDLQWTELIALQREQLRLLSTLCGKNGGTG